MMKSLLAMMKSLLAMMKRLHTDNIIFAQIDLLTAKEKGYSNQVYLLPKELDEKVASLHLPALGADLTILSKEQADYIGVKATGPFKPDTYRYGARGAAGLPGQAQVISQRGSLSR